MLVQFAKPEHLGILGLSKEEKIYKTLSPTFPDITVDGVSNLFKLYTAASKQFNYIPSDDSKKTVFVNYMYSNSGLDKNLIAVFIDRVKDAITTGEVDIKDINPNINKSTWQYYIYPVLGLIALIAIVKFSSNVKGIATLYKMR